MLLSVIIAAFSLSQAHHAVPGPGSVPATGAVVHAWSHCYIAAFSLSQSQDAIPGQSVPAQELWFTLGITATLLLSPFLRHTTLFLVLSQPQKMLFTLGVTATMLLSPFLRHTTLFLVLDLSQPQELWFTLESLLQTAKSRVEAVIADVKSTDPDIKQKLQKAAWERVGEENPVKCGDFIVRNNFHLNTVQPLI